MSRTTAAACAAFELRFTPLALHGRSFSFPCDAAGQVDIDGLSERARNNYFYARHAAGREFAWPSVALPVDAGRQRPAAWPAGSPA